MSEMKFKELGIKTRIQYICAFVMMLFGCILCVCGFITPPVGEISSSVVGVFGICLTFAGSALGIALYVRNQVDDAVQEFISKSNKKEY